MQPADAMCVSIYIEKKKRALYRKRGGADGAIELLSRTSIHKSHIFNVYAPGLLYIYTEMEGTYITGHVMLFDPKLV